MLTSFGRLQIDVTLYMNRNCLYMPSSTAADSCSQHMRMVLRQPLVNWTRSSYSKIYRDHFWSNGPEVVLFLCLCFIENSTCESGYCSATFGRGISDEVKLSCADDMGVWFSGLNACNFRRILLFLLFAESQGAYGLAKLCCNLAKASVYTVLHVSSHLKK